MAYSRIPFLQNSFHTLKEIDGDYVLCGNDKSTNRIIIIRLNFKEIRAISHQ